MNRTTIAAGALVLGLAAVPSAARAQARTFDRTEPPALTPPPKLVLPAAQTVRLANGLTLHVVEMHEVPIVQFSLMVPAGGRRDAGQPGLASFTADMLDEGADTLDAFGIAAQSEYLGATLSTGADWDDIVVSLSVPKRTMEPALALMAAVALRPTFASAEIQRQRDLRLAGILQQRDQPEVVASLAFDALVFPASHPYHYSIGGDSASTAALDSATVRGFYRRFFVPSGAELIVTGDITPAEARRAAERAFGKWAAPKQPVPALPQVPAAVAAPTTVYFVDKPGAAQSVIQIGGPGVERSNPDYAALQVMNTILGGSFSSRLNSNLRETKGYTYGAGSGFAFRPLPGPFEAGASVRTDVTDSALVEFFREIRSIRDSQVDAAELERARSYLVLGLAARFETTAQMAGQIAQLVTFGLPLDYYNGYVPQVMAVTAADVQRVAQKYLQPDRYAIVVVGDLSKIRAGVEALKLGPSSVRNLYGEEVK